MEGASFMKFAAKVATKVVLGALAVSAGVGLVACSKNRPLNIVRRDADWAMQEHKYENAERDYQAYLDRKPEENAVRVSLAKAQMGQGKAREAANNLYVALDVDPLNDKIIDTYAQALYQSGDRDALTAFVNRAASERQRVVDYIRVAKYMQAVGHPDEARQALHTAAKLDDGKSFPVQMSLADFYKTFGDRERYVRRLRMAYFLNPENPELVRIIREAGEVPGPTFALAPEEMSVPTISAAPER
jgi:predicted Zn-dependent protease